MGVMYSVYRGLVQLLKDENHETTNHYDYISCFWSACKVI